MAPDHEKKLASYRRYHAKHRAELKTKYVAYNAAHKEERKAWSDRNRLATTGVSPEMFVEYLDAQEGCCAYCGYELPRDVSKIAADHDHATGVFRGLMHILCNGALGFAEAHYAGFMASVRGGVWNFGC